MATFLVEIDERDESSAHNVVALVNEGLLQVFLQRLHVQVIDDLGKHSERVSLVHFVFVLTYVLGQLGDDDENFVLVGFKLLDEDVH